MGSYGVFYFSGTGNSLYAAKRLGDLLPGAVLTPISSAVSPAVKLSDFAALVFVFPVYFLALPRIIKDYLTTASFGATQRVYVLVTHGGDPGNALFQAKALLGQKGIALSGGFDLPMGDNSLIIRTSADTLSQRNGKIESLVSTFACSILSEQDRGVERGTVYRFRRGHYVLGKIYDWLFDWYFDSRNGRADHQKCTGCGVCAKICPVSNIKMIDSSPEWGKQCADCFGCINRCPQNAVHLGRIHPKSIKAQYRGPSIKTESSMA